MSFIRYFIALLTFLLFTAASLVAQNKVLIIAGAGGTPEFENMFYQQAVGLHDLLIESFGYESKDIVVLVADTPDSIEQIYAKATAKNIRNYFVNDASGMSSQSNLFCFFIGHDSYDNEWGKFNISGKDLRDFDYSQLLNSVPFNKLLFINMASASGTFIDKLSKENRVIITATRDGFEKNATQFASQFLETLSN
ncbi:hypothetical protein KC799_13755, partial [candidate division KSB1 bacterium]|nr:hypothetical protein [candidate division KSB1 bacterium]